jgi:hypothetical protein
MSLEVLIFILIFSKLEQNPENHVENITGSATFRDV